MTKALTKSPGCRGQAWRRRLLSSGWLLLLALSFFTPVAPPALATDHLDILIFERPPYYQIDPLGGPTGLVVEPVVTAMAKAGLTPRWHLESAERHLDILRSNEGPICALGWFKTHERESFAKFSEPVYRDQPMVSIMRADNDRARAHKTLEALLTDRGLTFGRKMAFSYGNALDARLKALRPPTFTSAKSVADMIQQVALRRFDYLFAAAEEADTLLADPRLADAGLVGLQLDGMPPADNRHLICSNSVDDDLLGRLNAAMRSTISEEL